MDGLVFACIAPHGGLLIPLVSGPDGDKALASRAAMDELGRRIAFIASLDLAHRHRADGPFGFDPAAAECDAAVLDAVRANALDRLLAYDTTWADRGLTEAVEPLLALHGVLEGTDVRAEVLSYEVPTYYGMMCAAYGR
ncbi:MAG TPA: hypothetical protein VHB98_13305 [Chloroflexota bacterium]|jgi:aromatic ring-opening dioxygenase LigB subunit|nr:hypothetical protein [Chloroflexota bacterium]